ncbi:glutamine amidotransferase (plasmid) [Halorussus limi]|uniref:Glutamine amidotransferase n=1 Tax=Halorussus limi TaxID=2938695 RepID=A0A8U0I0C8_9EURY|nr:glutamine amidotransferase [Halorussus limi]UPV76825.1 glutamine amidotransferase [Halorussus limi]
MTNVLLAGESWVTVQFEIKGRNVLQDSQYGEAADRFVSTLEEVGASVTYQPCHVAAESFPRTTAELDEYDLVILSDVGADTLQITDRVADGDTDVDRCALLAEWVREGGALGMVGGYMSFAGKGGQARYGRTPVADVLPVEVSAGDDRVETPDGAVPQNEGVPGADLPAEWPHVLGYNRTVAKSDADVWATVRSDPFLAVGDYGDGSSFAYATDCAPHWAPEGLLSWDHLPTLWRRVLDRVT